MIGSLRLDNLFIRNGSFIEELLPESKRLLTSYHIVRMVLEGCVVFSDSDIVLARNYIIGLDLGLSGMVLNPLYFGDNSHYQLFP